MDFFYCFLVKKNAARSRKNSSIKYVSNSMKGAMKSRRIYMKIRGVRLLEGGGTYPDTPIAPGKVLCTVDGHFSVYSVTGPASGDNVCIQGGLPRGVCQRWGSAWGCLHPGWLGRPLRN